MTKTVSDEAIVALYFARDEEAIRLTEEKHGKMIRAICQSILHDSGDAEECCNSVYFSAWSKIPPENPRSLGAFLSFLARSTAIDRYRAKTREKRAGELDKAPFEELENLFSDAPTPEEKLEKKELSAVLDRFLASLPPDRRRLFLRRYYFEESALKIARERGVSRRALYKHLEEMKKQLWELLRREGYLP